MVFGLQSSLTSLLHLLGNGPRSADGFRHAAQLNISVERRSGRIVSGREPPLINRMKRISATERDYSQPTVAAISPVPLKQLAWDFLKLGTIAFVGPVAQ